VAVVAGVATLDVCRRFALGCGAVMTRAARAKHGVVVDSRDILKARGRMTVFANIGCAYVSRVFTRRIDAVMAR
jgi:hypothetical protein